MVAFIGVGGGSMLAIMNLNIPLSGGLEGFTYIITFVVVGTPCAISPLSLGLLILNPVAIIMVSK